MYFMIKLNHVQLWLEMVLDHVHSYSFIIVCRYALNLSPKWTELNWAGTIWNISNENDKQNFNRVEPSNGNLWQGCLIHHPSVRLKCKFFISDSCQFVKNLSMFYQQCAVQQKWFKGFLLRHFIIFNERTSVCFCKGMNQLNNRVTHIPAILQWYIIIHLHLSNIHNTQYDHYGEDAGKKHRAKRHEAKKLVSGKEDGGGDNNIKKGSFGHISFALHWSYLAVGGVWLATGILFGMYFIMVVL